MSFLAWEKKILELTFWAPLVVWCLSFNETGRSNTTFNMRYYFNNAMYDHETLHRPSFWMYRFLSVLQFSIASFMCTKYLSITFWPTLVFYYIAIHTFLPAISYFTIIPLFFFRVRHIRKYKIISSKNQHSSQMFALLHANII